MIKLLNCSLKDKEDLLANYGVIYNDSVYYVQRKGEIIGIIEYKIPYEYSLKIEYIRIREDYKGNGYGKEIIKKIKESFPEHEIYGDSLPTKEAIFFWLSLGAEFDEDYEHIIDNRELNESCIPFTLY